MTTRFLIDQRGFERKFIRFFRKITRFRRDGGVRDDSLRLLSFPLALDARLRRSVKFADAA